MADGALDRSGVDRSSRSRAGPRNSVVSVVSDRQISCETCPLVGFCPIHFVVKRTLIHHRGILWAGVGITVIAFASFAYAIVAAVS